MTEVPIDAGGVSWSAAVADFSLRWVFVAGTLLVATALAWSAKRYCERHYWTQWYAPGDDYPPTGRTPEDLELVRRTAMGDPLRFQQTSRRLPLRVDVRNGAVAALTGIALLALVLYFLTTPMLGPSQGAGVADRAALVLALTAAVLSLFAVFYQTRANVLSANRQDWIHRVRAVLARLEADVALRGPQEESAGRRETRETRIERDLASLELHLNPAELDHRVLVALLRRGLDRERCGMGDVLLKDLGAPTNGVELRLWITRLSTAILKREWEQVKHVR